jgi:chorismate mutase
LTASPDLAALRAEIDRIDDHIAQLLAERLGVVREVGRAKGDLAAGRLAIRLAREAQMMRRLLDRTAGQFPPGGVLRIWREIIANSTQIEAPYACVVDARGGVLLHDLARDQVGSATPIETMPDAEAAIGRLQGGPPLLAVLGPPDAAFWWPRVLGGDVQIVARLPLTLAQGPVHGFVAARLEPEPSGDDRTLCAARLPDFNVPPEGRVLATDGEGRYLIELDGFATEPPATGNWQRLGCYAAPLALPDGPASGEHG